MRAGEHESTRAGALLTLLAFALGTVSCFSDRNVTAPINTSGECRIPLSVIGPNKIVVAMRDFNFFPDTVRIKPGTQVTWVNCETDVVDYHTSTATGVWDSGALNRGEFYTRTFDTRGNFGYFCIPHPFMRGAVIVE
jgi:plastocyanin